VIWGPLLSKFNFIIELDLSSGFPNLSLHGVRKSLVEDSLVPRKYINLILQHLTSPLVSSSFFPTLETFVEDKENEEWRKSPRSVHMGLGISPLLFVIALNWGLKQIKWYCEDLQYKWYADDGSIYFNSKWFWKFLWDTGPRKLWINLLNGENPILSYLHNSTVFKELGLRICPKKSGFVRILNVWVKPFKSLGLSLYTKETVWRQVVNLSMGTSPVLELRGSTRGRGANPVTGKAGTLPSNTMLQFRINPKSPILDFKVMKNNFRDRLGLIMSILYSPKDIKEEGFIPLKPLKKVKGETLLKLIHQRTKLRKIRKGAVKLNLYNIGSYCNGVYLQIQGGRENLHLERKLRERVKVDWVKLKTRAILLEEVELNLPEHSNNLDREYFKKYSELTVPLEKLKQYRELWLKSVEKENSLKI
jgi:hypothetical protein